MTNLNFCAHSIIISPRLRGLKHTGYYSRQIAIALLCIVFSCPVSAQKKNTDSKALDKLSHDEWLQSLPVRVRDSIVYQEWQAAKAQQQQQASDDARARVEAALSTPDLISLDLSYYPNAELDPRIVSLKKVQRINLSKARKLDLKKLFDLLAQLPELHTLSLADGMYIALPSNIAGLKALDTLIFNNNNIKALPETFTQLQHLHSLQLQHNAYLFDDDLFDKLKQMSVTSLDLSACGLFQLNDKITEVKSLVCLNLSANDIKQLPASFPALTGLRVLQLDQNTSMDLSAIATTLSRMSVSDLSMNDSYLSALPAEIGSIHSLRRLSLMSNVLTALPAAIGSLDVLEELYISSPRNSFRINVIRELPTGFGRLTRLRVLDLAGNQLTALSSDFDHLSSLEVLDLSRNLLVDFPPAVLHLSHLRELYLSRNKISSIPDGIGDLTALETLEIDGDFFNKPERKIKTLPAAICSLYHLKKLSLKDNVIETLPDHFGALAQLEYFDIRGNLLSVFPASFSQLTQLHTLDLKGNELKALPPGIARFSMLTELNISMNLGIDFSRAIPELAQLRTLRSLDISYNNLTRLQAQPLIDGLPDCHIVNLDYSRKTLPDAAASPVERAPADIPNRPQAPGRH